MLRFILIFAMFFLGQSIGAWEAHYLLTYAALRDWPQVSQEATIIPESLDSFVKAQKDALVVLLGEHELWAKNNIKKYPSLPPSLVFKATTAADPDLTKKFLMALRINPDISYSNFLLYPSGVAHRIKNSFSAQELLAAPLSSLILMRTEQPVLEKIMPCEQVSALEILVSASEEPDHGLDLGLWQDNQTWYGRVMGFGKQPFGNPTLSYSSQAPFHMGYFHEASILYWGAPWLSRCYPEYRIYTFLSLARFALARGHNYWGYRFLGWALHYLQDLSQPYHATLAPGISLAELVWTNVLEIIGVDKQAADLRQLLTNRHLALENFQFESIRAILHNKNLELALSDVSHDQQYPAFDNSYARQIITTHSLARAETTDSLLRKALPSMYVTDPSFIFPGPDPTLNLRGIAFSHDKIAATKLEQEFLSLMKALGSHTRNTVRSLLPK
jgi:hypothetical protein